MKIALITYLQMCLTRAEYRTRIASLRLLRMHCPPGHEVSSTAQTLCKATVTQLSAQPCTLPPLSPFPGFRQAEKLKQHVQSSLCVCRSYRNTVMNGSLMLNKAWWGTESFAGSRQVQWKSGSTLIPAENKACYNRWNSTDSTVCVAISRCSKHQLVFQPVPRGFRFGSNQTNLICTLVFCSLGH